MKIVNIYLQARSLDDDGSDWRAVDTFNDAATAQRQLDGARRDDLFREFRLDDRSYDITDADYGV